MHAPSYDKNSERPNLKLFDFQIMSDVCTHVAVTLE